MSANNPFDIDTSGISAEVADALAVVIASLKSASAAPGSHSAALTLSEVVSQLRSIGA